MPIGQTGQSSPIEEPEDIKECIALYIRWRIRQLNDGVKFYRHKLDGATVSSPIDKDERKEIKEELCGFGGLVRPKKLRIKKNEKRDVKLLIGREEIDFTIDGVIDTGRGKIIGYYCAYCLECVSVKEVDYLFYVQGGVRYCLYCYAVDISPLFEAHILRDKGKS